MTKKETEHDKLQDLTKARGVFFQNYDPYETEGPGPGAGLYSGQYESVSDFRKKKRKRKMRNRKKLLQALLYSNLIIQANDSNDLAEPDDESLTPVIWNAAEPSGSPIGIMDGIYPEEDLESTPKGNPYYGQNETHAIDG